MAASLMASLSVGCPWQDRAMSSVLAPYSIASTHLDPSHASVKCACHHFFCRACGDEWATCVPLCRAPCTSAGVDGEYWTKPKAVLESRGYHCVLLLLSRQCSAACIPQQLVRLDTCSYDDLLSPTTVFAVKNLAQGALPGCNGSIRAHGMRAPRAFCSLSINLPFGFGSRGLAAGPDC